jgi:hypothetical protein
MTGFALVIDCRSAQCGGEQSYAVPALGARYGGPRGGGGRPAPDALRTRLWRAPSGGVAGDRADAQRPRRVPLLGPEVRE